MALPMHTSPTSMRTRPSVRPSVRACVRASVDRDNKYIDVEPRGVIREGVVRCSTDNKLECRPRGNHIMW